MSIPNVLTAFRFVLIPVYVTLFCMGGRAAAFAVWLLAGFTDILDGHLARKRNEVTYVGMMLDPLADKLMMIAVMLTLLFAGDLPMAAALAMFIRDGGMIAGAVWINLRGKKTPQANGIGKMSTVLYYVAIVCIYFQWEYAVSLLWAVIAFSYFASLQYVVKWIKQNQQLDVDS